KPDLAQVFTVSAQNRHFAPAEICPQDQPVEVVIFNLAAPCPRERVLETAFQTSHIEHQILRITHAQVMQINRLHPFQLHPVIELFKDLDAHVFEHWQA